MSEGQRDGTTSVDEHAAEPASDGASPERAQRFGRWLGRVCCVLCGLVAALGLAGWVTGSVRLTSVSPEFPTIAQNAVLALCLAPAAWWLLTGEGRSRARIFAGVVAAALMTGIGLLALLEYAIGPLGLDELVFRVPASFMRYPKRPSLPTALALMACGISLLLLRFRSRRSIQPSDYAAAIAGILGLEGLASYAFGAAPTYGIPGEPPQPAMALMTALALLPLCVALVMARPSMGLAALLLGRSMGGVAIRRILLSAVLFPVLALLVMSGFNSGFYKVEVAASAIMTGGLGLGFVMAIVTGLRLDRAERALRELRERIERLYEQEALKRAWLQTVINQLPEGVILLDAAGTVAAINAAALACTSGSTDKEDPLGNAYIYDMRWPSGEAVAFDDLPLVRAFRHQESTQGEELLLRCADGRLVPIMASAAPVRDEAGKLLGAALIMQNITARKEIERQREEWSSIIAHDLRQPLGIVAFSASLLTKSALSERDSRHVGRIRAAAGRLGTIINDLLDASRLEANRLTIQTAPEDLPALVERILEHLAPVISGNPVSVTRRGTLRPVLVDSGRIEQVLGNLLSNAVKYGEPGAGIELTLEDEGEAARITVTNPGRGIPADELGSLFHRFKRSAASKTGKVKGIGLGLYICKGLIEAHGGRIGVESTPGELTGFYFTLPYAPESEPERADG